MYSGFGITLEKKHNRLLLSTLVSIPLVHSVVMFDYQFPASILLAASATISATVNLSTSRKGGGIKLEELECDREDDPFDVTTPEDISPGEPIDSPRFWSRVRV